MFGILTEDLQFNKQRQPSICFCVSISWPLCVVWSCLFASICCWCERISLQQQLTHLRRHCHFELHKTLYKRLLFLCYIGNKLLYLDPHVTQQVVEVEKYSDIPDQVCSLSLLDFLIFPNYHSFLFPDSKRFNRFQYRVIYQGDCRRIQD